MKSVVKKRSISLLLSLIVLIFSGGVACADWQSTLSAAFPFAQTFNNLNDWMVTGSAGDVRAPSLMPVETGTGTVGVWRYYSTWATPTGNGIEDHGPGLSVNPKGEAISKSLLIDYYGGAGPSRLAADIRTTAYPNGFKWADGVRVFYAIKRNPGFWSSSPDGYLKEAVLNMECNASSCDSSGANYAVSPYFDYHWTHDNGVNPAVLISNATHAYVRESGNRTDMRNYDGQWLYIEDLVTPNIATHEATLSEWIYDSNGNLIKQLYNNISASVFSSTEWAASVNGYFDNFMLGGNMHTPVSGSQSYYDDIIIDVNAHGPIAPRYFALANGTQKSGPDPSPMLRLDSSY